MRESNPSPKPSSFPKRAILTFCCLFFLPPTLSAYQEELIKKAAPFLTKHCVGCHGPEKEKGDLRIDLLTPDYEDLDSLEHFQNMLDEITIGAMPPEEEPRPNDEELETIISALTAHIEKAAAQQSKAGGRPVRRLTKIEYANTVEDLLGVRINGRNLADDGGVGIFDTDASALYTNDLFMENYLAVARDAVRRFIASRNLKPSQELVHTLPAPKKGNLNITPHSTGSKKTRIPPAGHLVVRLSLWRTSPKGKAIFTGPNGARSHKITGTPSEPQIIDRVFSTNEEEIWAIPKGVKVGPTKYYRAINPEPYYFFQKFLNRYQGANPPDSAAIHIIREFANLMSRGRFIEPSLIEGLNEVFLLGRKMGEPFWEALIEPMAISMCTLESMFHFESKGTDEERSNITSVELTNRLSYFLWRSAPNPKIMEYARDGVIDDPEKRVQLVDWMIAQEGFDRFLHDYTDQWLELERQELIAVETRLFTRFDESIRDSIREETYQFMAYVIKNNLSITNLIDSDFIIINNELANHYGIPDVSGQKFQKVKLPANSPRGGILTQAGILMQTGTGARTSIVERGVFISRKLLNIDPPPPPPLVEDLPESGEDFLNMTGAELVRTHASTPQCASCHSKFDPLGVGLEAFDAVGLVRKKDIRLRYPLPAEIPKGTPKKRHNETVALPIETNGRVFKGEEFEGVEGLKKGLMAHKERLAYAYVESLFSFALGRKVGVQDKATIDAIVKESAAKDYPALSILKAIVRSERFTSN